MTARLHCFGPLFVAALGCACSSAEPDDSETVQVASDGGALGALSGGAAPVETGSGGADPEGSGGAAPMATGGNGAVGTGGEPGSVFEPPPWPERPTTGGPVWVRARNLCPFTLWVNSSSGGQTLSAEDVELGPGETVDWDAPSEWPAARLTAFKEGPGQGEIEKAEMTIGGGLLNYNVTYVDWLGLPLEVVGVGAGCNDADHATGCYAPLSEVLEGCPEPLLASDGRCLSPRSYCWDEARQTEAICTHLDAAIASCSDCPEGTTHNVYACNGPYSEEPRLCAALNRGMVDDPDANDPALYYQNGPYNEYAKWSHQQCPGIYAFSYDDWNAQGGFRACTGDELRITFCPGG